MPDEFDPFEPETGLPNKVNVKIVSCHFGTDVEIQAGEAMMWYADCTTDNENWPEYNLRFGCGKGWEVKDRGRRIVRDDGTQKTLHANSTFMKFVQAALEAGAPLREVAGPTGPLDAGLFEDMEFYMETVTMDFGGEIGKKGYLFPKKYLGGKDKKSKAAGAKSAAPKKEASESSDDELPTDLRNQLLKIAVAIKEEGKGYEDFVAAAFELDGVDGDAAAEAAVGDDSAGSIWAEA